ncbi:MULTISPECIES: YheC/YheD family protein [Bacillaceae]|uniref:YheC/YheD family protein n=1 Tax=Evansella alkalicola TaxID=745819 RepID=A0ABS6JYF7_9BACI|nr:MULTISPECIES: YheC/YheD family protein [Bacillaceae]MBU9723619.1 YheC/YheD family protein [Bacillus alkalicola]
MEENTKEQTTIIGVFLPSNSINKIEKNKGSLLWREMVEANKNWQTTLYFFCEKDIDYNTKEINGIYFDTHLNKWTRNQFPYPNILYRRVSTLNQEKCQKFLKQIEERNIMIINYDRIFNKWDLHQQCSNSSFFSKYLPETIDYENRKSLLTMLNKYKELYLKKYCSGQGKDVLKVIKFSPSHYECQYFRTRLRIKTFRSFSSLVNYVESFFQNKEFIIQEAIRFQTYNGRPFDIRAELQRDINNQINITGITVRAGKKKSPVTTHGNSYKLESFFIKKLHYTKKEFIQLEQEMNTFLKDVYKNIEKIYGSCGELGIDFGIDQDHKLWFIETNAQTKKVSLRKAYGSGKVRETYNHLLGYAKLLTDKPELFNEGNMVSLNSQNVS